MSGKWAKVMQSDERFTVVSGLLMRIRSIARSKGFTGSYYEMSKAIADSGVPVSKGYIRMQIDKSQRYVFPLEAIIVLCSYYSIPISEIFILNSPE